MSASFASWLISMLLLAAALVALALTIRSPRAPGKALRRLRKRSCGHTARRCPACRAAASESAPHLIEVNYLLPDAAPHRTAVNPAEHKTRKEPSE